MTKYPTVKLNNGNEMPQIGMGTMFIMMPDDFQGVIDHALAAGYRFFDTAALYGNEAQLGQAFKNNGIAREELFISSKLKNGHHEYEDALNEFEKTRKRLQVDYLDLYLIHYPCPAHGLYTEAWKALEHLYKEGYVRNIGVSNFEQEHLEKVLDNCEVKPVVDQLECNPYVSIAPLRKFLAEKEIVAEAYFPLGGPTEPRPDGSEPPANLRKEPVIIDIAKKTGKTVSQVCLRWEVQHGMIVIPRSGNPIHMAENMDIFGFELSEEDMAAIDALNFDYHIAPTGDNCNEVWD